MSKDLSIQVSLFRSWKNFSSKRAEVSTKLATYPSTPGFLSIVDLFPSRPDLSSSVMKETPERLERFTLFFFKVSLLKL